MASLYTVGETKVRPGVYRRYTTTSVGVVAGADDGTVAAVIQADWGPLGVGDEITTVAELEELYGKSDSVKKVAFRALQAGANKLRVVRVGADGTSGSYEVKAGEKVAVTLSTKYPSDRAFKVTIQSTLADAGMKELIVYEGTTVIEKVNFVAGDSEIQNLVDAVNQYSAVFTAKTADGATGKIADVTQASITAGTNPTTKTENYSTALSLLEPYRFNVLCVDSGDSAVHTLVHAFVTRMKSLGALFIAVVGEPKSVAFKTRIQHSAAFNDENVVYVGGSAIDTDGDLVEGYEAAAIVAGMIASTPSNDSIVHATVTDMEDLGENLVGYDPDQTRATQLGLRSLRMARRLCPGHVITDEPGIYFIPALIEKFKKEGLGGNFVNYAKLEGYYDFGGIRLEDDILITPEGARRLGHGRLPISPEEVENAMAR